MTSLPDLRNCTLASLEELYRTAPLGPLPSGRYRGRVLTRVDNRLAHSRRGDVILAPFERAPFGVDFATATWYFFWPWVRVGHFRVERARSRWRDAEVLGLHYDVSRLPGPIRGFLYDEVKPLTETTCLGLGGINDDRGDLFFFVLERRGAGSRS